jgi:GNAT superfamily N-acetyltransferase
MSHSAARTSHPAGSRRRDVLPLDRALDLARRPWALDVPGQRLVVRGARPADLEAVATMHGRCARSTLLQRYGTGGRAPSLPVLTEMLAQPLVLVVLARPRHAVALASVAVGRAPLVEFTAESSLLVEDAWQRMGIGRTLAGHLGASMRYLGYGQVTTSSATVSLPLTRVMEHLGTTRVHAGRSGARITTRLQLSPADAFAGGATVAG